MIKNCLLSSLMFFALSLNGQKQDHIWLFGNSAGDNTNPDISLQDSTWGSTNIDFNYDPPKISYDSTRIWDFEGTNSSICNLNGELELYTNGQAVYAGDHSVIEDTINYNYQWDNWSYYNAGVFINAGLPTMQGALTLKLPDSESTYYIFSLLYELIESSTLDFQYSVVEYDNTINSYYVSDRDLKVLSEPLTSGNLNAVRHANGRDWWIINSSKTQNIFYKYLFTPHGIEYYSEEKIFSDFGSVHGQLFFNNVGDKMALCHTGAFGVDGVQVLIGEFDRSTGEIKNVVEDKLEGNTFSHGVSWSPNGRFVYATDSDVLYQYDTWADDIIASRLSVEEYDGYEYVYPEFYPDGSASRFGWMGLAPDGKIYLSSTSGSTRVMHKINNPNYLGAACDMDQHSIFLPTSYARTMPNFPNFRLGPLDDSPADTLGLNNHPVAKYRYVQDTLEDLRVHFFDLSYYDPQDYEWDFGDGNTSDELEPNHIYAEKGVYEVCLTVSNIYDTNTSCKTIMLGTTSTIDRELVVDVSIYPNPTSDYLTINFQNYIALDGVVRFYDVSGDEVIVAELDRSSNVLNLAHFVSGAYIYKVYDGDDEIYEGKVVVVK